MPEGYPSETGDARPVAIWTAVSFIAALMLGSFTWVYTSHWFPALWIWSASWLGLWIGVPWLVPPLRRWLIAGEAAP